jgi:hypothetical protein
MQGISTFSWYPRGTLGLQNLGPGVASGFITAGKPTRLVNGPGATKVTKPISNTFEFNPNTLKDAVGFRVSEPERIIHPNLKPTVSFSLPTTSKRLDALNLREDINKDTGGLEGADLLGKLVTYVMDLYKSGSSPFELSASPFQSLVNACKRLNLNTDPTLAGLPKTVDQRMPFGTFVKVNIWLMGADQVFDKSLKPGYIYIAQQKVPVSTLVSDNRPKAYVLDLFSRRASVGVPDASLADIAEGPRLPDVGQIPQGGPNLADGRDGRQNVASQDPVVPEEKEVERLLDVTARAVNDAADLDAALLALERPESLRYGYRDVVIPKVLGVVEEEEFLPLPPEFEEKEPGPFGDAPERQISLLQNPDADYKGYFPRLVPRHREAIYVSMAQNPDIFNELVARYKRRQPVKNMIEGIINSVTPDGDWAFPAIRDAAELYQERFNGGANNFVEMLVYIMRNNPFMADQDKFAGVNLKKIKLDAAAELAPLRAQLRQLRQAVNTKDFKMAAAAIRAVLAEDEDNIILKYIQTRDNEPPLDLAQSLLTLNNTKGLVGLGKAKRKAKKKTKKRAKPY